MLAKQHRRAVPRGASYWDTLAPKGSQAGPAQGRPPLIWGLEAGGRWRHDGLAAPQQARLVSVRGWLPR